MKYVSEICADGMIDAIEAIVSVFGKVRNEND